MRTWSSSGVACLRRVNSVTESPVREHCSRSHLRGLPTLWTRDQIQSGRIRIWLDLYRAGCSGVSAGVIINMVPVENRPPGPLCRDRSSSYSQIAEVSGMPRSMYPIGIRSPAGCGNSLDIDLLQLWGNPFFAGFQLGFDLNSQIDLPTLHGVRRPF